MATTVEFTGLTCSGKTTLVNAVIDALADRGFEARDAYDLILARYGLNLAPHPVLRSLFIDLVAFPPFLRYIFTRKGLELLLLAIRVISRDAGGFLEALNLGRNFAKRLGVHVLLSGPLRQSGNCDFAISDEGTLHIAHNLFVHADRSPDPSEIVHFARIVPMPDLAICVRASKDHSIECILQRGHSRVDDSRGAAQTFVEHGHLAFDILWSEVSLQGKLFTIDNAIESDIDRSITIHDRANAVADFLTENPMVQGVNSLVSHQVSR